MSRIELIGGEGTTSRPGAPCRSRLMAGGGPLAMDERRQVGGAFGDTGDGEGVCLRSSRCSRMATARLGTSGREGSGYSPLAAMTGATMLAVGSSSLERPVVVEKASVLGHILFALLHGAVFGLSQRGAECSIMPPRQASETASTEWRRSPVLAVIGGLLCRMYPMAVTCGLFRGQAKVNSSTQTGVAGAEAGQGRSRSHKGSPQFSDSQSPGPDGVGVEWGFVYEAARLADSGKRGRRQTVRSEDNGEG